MSIAAKQSIDTDFDFTVKQVPVPHPLKKDDDGNAEKSGYFMNIREDNDEILGWTSERYGIVNHSDVLRRADDAFESRGIDVSRKVVVTEGGAKMRAQYDLSGDLFKAEVPAVGDVMAYRLTAQNSFDRSLRVSFALGLVRLICTNGMTTTEKEVDMVKKHSKQLNIADLVSDTALDAALAKLKNSVTVYGRLAQVDLTEEQGLNILKTLTQGKILSEKLREEIAKIWINPTHEEDKGRNLYNLNNAVTQHMTHAVAEERFELSNRVTRNVLKRFDLASRNPNRLKKLWTPAKEKNVVVTVAE
ncbi:hypothetical protein CMI37_06770 [Candidatus Pacearchaeota archaeon]|nr:hypothetical protein [Candidatus Pacearchaeota archaeon]|tara:strand:- start:2283 stop:3191 length:909 start_codon:yes stop_codon:yes gene_type:complete